MNESTIEEGLSSFWRCITAVCGRGSQPICFWWPTHSIFCSSFNRETMMNFVLSNWIYEFIHIVNTLNSILLPRLLPNGSRQSVFFFFLFVSQKSIGLSTFSFGRKDVTINILNTSKWCMIKTIVCYSRRYNERSDTCIGTHNAHITRHYFIVQGFSMYNVMETYGRAIYQLAKWRWIVSLYLLLAQD